MSAADSFEGSECPDENALDGYAAGALVAHERIAIKAHLLACETCQLIVAALARTSAPADTQRSLEHLPGILESDELALPRGTRVSRFSILERVGAGGMGVVYAAFDAELERRVALKFLRSVGGDLELTTGRERMVQEAQSMAKLAHPHIVTVFDVGSFGGGVYIAMEFVEGRTLRAFCAERARTPDEILAVFLQAARGLAAAHEAGLVHRDFKPDNVLVGWDGLARVTDFGLARRVDLVEHAAEPPSPSEETSRAGTPRHPTFRAGTPRYMAPEQIEGGGIDARTDQFGFCVALYEALCGRPPFVSDDLEARVREIRGGQLAPMAVRGLSPRVEVALRRGLEGEPSRRFSSMLTLCEALAPARRRSWRAAVLVFASALLAAVVAFAVWPRSQGATCTATAVLPGWDAANAEQLERRLSATVGATTAGAARAELAHYAQIWGREEHDACRATHVLQAQSFVRLERRRDCLAERRHRFTALLTALQDGAVRAGALVLQAVRALPPLEECREPSQPPDVLSAFDSVDETARRSLAAAQAYASLDEPRTAVDLARRVARTAVGVPALEAALLVVTSTDDPELGRALGRDVVELAERVRQDRIAALAAARLATLARGQRSGALWARYARSVSRRAGGDAALRRALAGMRTGVTKSGSRR